MREFRMRNVSTADDRRRRLKQRNLFPGASKRLTNKRLLTQAIVATFNNPPKKKTRPPAAPDGEQTSLNLND